MKTKDVVFEVKAFDPDSGVFEGYASVFGVKDSYGDVVIAGAFAETLAADFGPGGAGVPCWWAHQFADPFMNIGSTIAAVEDAHGLYVKVQLDLSSNTGSRVHTLLVEKRVRQMSFGYEVLEGAFVESEENGYFYELRKLRLFEVSVVPIGANSSTEILSAKSGGDAVAAALRTAHGALLAAFKAAGVDPPPLTPPEPVEVPDPINVPAPIPAGDVLVPGPSGDEEPDASTGADEADPIPHEEPADVNAEEPAPPVNAEEPTPVKSLDPGSNAILRARAAMALAGV